MSKAMEERFKRYEAVSDHTLVRRTPVIGRLDGKAFHTLTRGCQKPFDWNFNGSMVNTAVVLCKEIQGCKMAYVQSDEISLLIVDYDTIQTEPWLNYRIGKMTSIAAALASVFFTRDYEKVGLFDARFFNVPENDVCNYFVFRQRDAERNSLNMVAQHEFSSKQLHKKNSQDIHEMLHEKGLNWNDLPSRQKRGTVVVKGERGWEVMQETPSFSQDRDFVELFLPSGDE